ncbi:MAG: tetratricopeptide (TPR) repeat protein [Candidatus Krumholzibacteriia bacterium]|jgi:tetratricopeptide (TPR) repeat protein
MVSVKLKAWILSLAVAFSATTAWADFVCDAEINRTSVARGGELVLTVSARGDVGWTPDFQLPNIADVRVYAGGSNQSMSVVNGKSETSVVKTYYLKVDAATDFTVGPIVIAAQGFRCTTDPLPIKVTAAVVNPPPANTGNRAAKPDREVPQPKNSTAGTPGDDIFVTLEADYNEAWVGQQIVLSFRYWRRVQPWNNPSYEAPRTEGFWREDLGAERNYRKVLHGRAYNVTEIRYAIFPTRIGELVVEPAELKFAQGVFDRFFQTKRGRRGPTSLRTDPVKIQVKELPKPHPANYSGIVASQLDLVSRVDRNVVPRGEAVGLKVQLTADGFLKGFRNLDIESPETTQLHDAGESFRTSVENDRLVGRLAWEKVIVPNVEGVVNLAAVKLVWFNTVKGAFEVARTADWDLTVTPSDLPLAGDDESGFLRSEVARLGDDLAFIHQVPKKLKRGAGVFTGHPIWWLLFVAPALALVAYRFLLNRRDAQHRDPAGRRRRGALAAAQIQLGVDGADRMNAIARAIQGFVADSQDYPVASVGSEDVLDYCESLGQVGTGRRLVDIMSICDAARFGKAHSQESEALAAEVGELLDGLAATRTHPDKVKAGLAKDTTTLALALGLSLLGAALLLPTSAIQAEESPGADPVRLLAEGNQAYTDADVETAVAKYLAVREMGVNDPVLHFNLGNAYARQGQLGQAVACYLRAQRLAPRDSEVRANLAWVRRHIADLELVEEPLPLFIAELATVVRALSLNQWGFFCLLSVWILCSLVAWGWYRGEVNPVLRRWQLSVLAMSLFVMATTGGHWYFSEVRQSAVVVVPEVVVRSGPAENFPALFAIHDGLTLSIVDKRQDWVRVGLGGDWQGWVPESSLVPVRQP